MFADAVNARYENLPWMMMMTPSTAKEREQQQQPESITTETAAGDHEKAMLEQKQEFKEKTSRVQRFKRL